MQPSKAAQGEAAQAAAKGGKRGPPGEVEGPRPKDSAGEPVGEGGEPPAEVSEVTAEGEHSLADARGAEPGDAAAAAGRRDDVEREEDPTRQPGQGGGTTEGRTTLTRRPTEKGARKARTAAGLGAVAEDEEEEREAAAALAEAGATAAAEGAVEPEESFEEMVEGYPGSFWTAIEEDIIEKPELMDWNEWQAWRSAEGGLPKGVRDRSVQHKEVALQGGDEEVLWRRPFAEKEADPAGSQAPERKSE